MTFDPYSAWLDLPPGRRPPDAHSLLGLSRSESDPEKISAAAAGRIKVVQRKAPFDRGDEMREVLDGIAAAEWALLDASRRRAAERVPAGGGKIAVTRSAGPDLSRQESAPRGSGSRRRSASAAWLSVLAGAAAVGSTAGVVWLAWPDADRGRETSESAADAAVSPAAVATEDLPGEAAGNLSERAGPIVSDEVTPTVVPVVADRPPVEPTKSVITKAAPEAVLPEPPAPVTPVAFPEVLANVPVPVQARRRDSLSVAAYRLPDFASEKDREIYAEHVRALLDAAFRPRGDVSAIESRLRQAAGLAPGGELAEYAAGLALWRRIRLPEAETHLQAAFGPESAPYLPARRASIRLKLNRNRHAEALSEATGLATALSKTPSPDEETAATARWLGRTIAALEAPWSPNAKPLDGLAEADAAIRGSLSAELAAGYDAGRASLYDDYVARSEAVEASIAGMRLAHEEQRTEALGELESNRETAAGERELVARSAAEWKQWLEKETKGIDAELTQLETAHRQLSFQAEAATATFLALNEQIANLQLQDNQANLPPTIVDAVSSAQLVAATNQAAAQMRILNAQLADVRRRAQVLLGKRQALVARFERETKTLAVRDDSLRKWEGILKKRAGETGAKEAADSPAAKALLRGLRDFDAYVPFDLEAERVKIEQGLSESAAAAT